MTRSAIRLSASFLGLGAILALSGCPSPSVPTEHDSGTTPMIDGGHDAAPMLVDAGTDAGPTTGDAGIDAATSDAGTDGSTGDDAAMVDAHLAPDMGLSSAWDNCGEAVVFGSEGESCTFTGSCIECVLTPAPRQALCMAGHLRVTAAGAGACTGMPDTGPVTFPDAGPPPDAGAGIDAGTCGPIQIATPTTAVCPMSIVDCIRAGTAIGTCVSMDSACLGCVQQDIQACATQTGGCDDEAGLARCCFQANCPDGSCSATTCATPWNAYVSCVTSTSCSASDACFPASPTCPALGWPAPTAVSCTMATRTCVAGAADGTAIQACLDADTTTPMGTCGTCFNDALISCITDMGTCTSDLGQVQCCLDANCPTGDSTCVNNALATGGACKTLWDGFFTCIDDALGAAAAGACTSHVNVCFP